MSLLRDPRHYREEAARYRERAAATFDNQELRESYLALARFHERLADTLERQGPSTSMVRRQDQHRCVPPDGGDRIASHCRTHTRYRPRTPAACRRSDGRSSGYGVARINNSAGRGDRLPASGALYATRRFGQKVGSVVMAAGLSTCLPGPAGGGSLTLSLFFSTGFPYCQVPASIASFISSSRARIRHSRRSLSLRTRTPSAFAVSQSHATPSCAQRSFARPRIVASLISVTAETILAFNACRMGAFVNGHYI
jgi:hypothetical protein